MDLLRLKKRLEWNIKNCEENCELDACDYHNLYKLVMDSINTAPHHERMEIANLRTALDTAQEALGDIRETVDRVEWTPFHRVNEIKLILTKAGA